MKMKFNYLFGIIAFILPDLTSAQQSDSTKIHAINKVVVSASRMQLQLKDIPQKVEIINQSLIETVPNRNIGEVLKSTLNLDIIEYPGTAATVSLRGFPVTGAIRGYTPILIDGMPSGTINLSTIPIDFIESVEVIKGPYSVLYGADAMGGVINIITKKCSTSPTGSVGIGVGSFGQTQYNGYVSGAISPKLLFSMGYSSYRQANDYRIGSSNLLKLSETEKNILDKKSYGDIMNNTQYGINQFSGKLDYLINDKWSAGIYTSLTSSNDTETSGNYWHSNGMKKADINRIANYGKIRYATDHNELLISPYLSVYKEDNYDNNTIQAFKESKQKIKQYGVKIGNTYSFGEFKWLIGSDIDNYGVNSENFTDKITQTAPFVPNQNRQSFSGFTQLAYIHNNVSVNTGVRYNYITYTIDANEFLGSERKSENYSNFNPSLGMKYTFTDHFSAHGSIGSAFFVPDAYKVAGYYTVFGDLYKGNKDLKPETTLSFDIGLNYSLGEYITADITYFQNYFKDRIIDDYDNYDFSTFTGYKTYKNVQKGTMNGLELMLSSNPAKLWTSAYRIEIYGEATFFLNNNLKDKVSDVMVTKDALYTRKTTANFGLNFNNNKGFEARLNSRFIGHRLEQNWMFSYDNWPEITNLRPDLEQADYYAKGGFTEGDQILRHPAHLIFDFSAYYTFNQKFRIGISVSNLWDENYAEKDGYNMPGRSIMGHFNFTF